jgi:hypothetical protein
MRDFAGPALATSLPTDESKNSSVFGFGGAARLFFAIISRKDNLSPV